MHNRRAIVGHGETRANRIDNPGVVPFTNKAVLDARWDALEYSPNI
jgi:hypothetical protein